ncbi:Hint domain-containing protein [Sagittula sp. SSi028]|uniref:Hint domain-containing protein n=1 Tax=Sagittula sp. SSi028 TaxID=3400636 RepID=UPI003AF57C89
MRHVKGADMCFVAGCNISTPGGGRPIEHIRAGDLVDTVDGRVEQVLWAGLSRIPFAEQMINTRKRPVRIGRGALGPQVPQKAVLISPQHRVLVRSRQVLRMLGSAEAFVPALSLTSLPGIRVMPPLPELEYLHLACARHSVLLVEGIGVESILPEPSTLQELGSAERVSVSEQMEWTPYSLRPGDHARPVLSMRKAETLVQRCMRSRMPMYLPPGAPQPQAREADV